MKWVTEWNGLILYLSNGCCDTTPSYKSRVSVTCFNRASAALTLNLSRNFERRQKARVFGYVAGDIGTSIV